MEANEIDEVVQEFLLESYENLDRLDDEFLELERDPTSAEVLASIFRTIHTIKGTAGFLGFDRLGQLTHAGENLLSRLRAGDLTLNQPRTNALLSLVDAVRELLAAIEGEGSEGSESHDAVMAALNASLLDDETAAEVVTAALEEMAANADRRRTAIAADPTGSTDDGVEANDEPAATSATPVDEVAPADPDGLEPEALVAPDVKRPDQSRSALSDSSVRIDIAQLDNLMNLVGELVLARNRILQVSSQDSDSLLQKTAQQLNLVTTELQEEVMRTRLQPIQTIWGRFPRVVRDLAMACNKQVRIEMMGEETELDRTIGDAIRDPLTHMVRNSVDHGIERPEARVAKGKPAEGTIYLSAFHEGSQVNIEIRDDGGGVDLAAVGDKAVSRGVITAEALERMTENQIINLIFEPGLSTAERVTNVSGRGVGMDVVRANIEKIGGTVEISSVLGQGTTMRMKIPLTLAIVPALLVYNADQPYAIPQVNVLELVRVDGEKAAKAIETVGRAKVYRLRGRLLPVLDLRESLGLDGGRWHRPRRPLVRPASGVPGTLTGEPSGPDALRDRLRERAFAALNREDETAGTQAEAAPAAPVGRGVTVAAPSQDLRARALAALAAESASEGTIDHDGDRDQTNNDALNIVVLEVDRMTFGLVVDRIDQTQEIVVKPLGGLLKHIPVYAGSTIMGDGRVALILDAMGLAKEAHVDAVFHGERDNAPGAMAAEAIRTESVLVCSVNGHRVALELPAVNRLENLAADKVEWSNGREVVQYHDGELLRLVRIEEFLARAAPTDEPTEPDPVLRVIVCTHNDEVVGLVVDDIIDIATRNLAKQQIRNEGIVTVSAVINGRVTDLLDVDLILAAASTPALSRW